MQCLVNGRATSLLGGIGSSQSSQCFSSVIGTFRTDNPARLPSVVRSCRQAVMTLWTLARF